MARSCAAIFFTPVIIVGLILLYPVFPVSVAAKIVCSILLVVLLAIYLWRFTRRVYSPRFSCPNCTGKVTFHWEKVSRAEEREIATCTPCELSAPTGNNRDPTAEPFAWG
jgi:hypothetical protein